MTPRIDPDLPFVWRTPETLQLGAPEALVVLERPTSAELDLLKLLRRGVGVGSLRAIAEGLDFPVAALDEWLAGLAPVLLPDAAPVSSVARARSEPDASCEPVDARPTVLVAGEGRLAELMRRALDALGHEVRSFGAADDRVAAHEASDHPEGSEGSEAPPAALAAVVLVADRVIRPAQHLPLLRRDVPHLAVVRHGSTATVGPFVLPGESACLRCVDLGRRDADDAWPVLASQLAAAPAPEPHVRADFEAAALAAGAVDDFLRGRLPALVEATVEVSGLGATPRRQPVAAHPACGCRVLEENETALGRLADLPRSGAPSSIRAVAVPA